MNRRAVRHEARQGLDEKFNGRRASGPSRVVAMLAAMVALMIATTSLGLATPSVSAAAGHASTDASLVASPVEPDEPVVTTPATTPPVETSPPITANDFIPEDQDLTTCIGVLERPGCGSESRGGWRQTLVLIALFGGMAIVFGRIAWGVTKNRRAQEQ